jgi:hypothetical protein
MSNVIFTAKPSSSPRNTNLNARQPKVKRINGYWHNEACRQIAEAAAEYIEASWSINDWKKY